MFFPCQHEVCAWQEPPSNRRCCPVLLLGLRNPDAMDNWTSLPAWVDATHVCAIWPDDPWIGWGTVYRFCPCAPTLLLLQSSAGAGPSRSACSSRMLECAVKDWLSLILFCFPHAFAHSASPMMAIVPDSTCWGSQSPVWCCIAYATS